MKWKKTIRFGKRPMAILLSLAMVLSGTSITGKWAKAASGDVDKKAPMMVDDKGEEDEKNGKATFRVYGRDENGDRHNEVYVDITEEEVIKKWSKDDGTPYEDIGHYAVRIKNGTKNTISDWELKIVNEKKPFSSYQVGWNGASIEKERHEINVGTYIGVTDDETTTEIQGGEYRGGSGFQVARRELQDATFTFTYHVGESKEDAKENARQEYPEVLVDGKTVFRNENGKNLEVTVSEQAVLSTDPKNYHQAYLKLKNNTGKDITDWIVAFKTSDITGVDNWEWLYDDDEYNKHEGTTGEMAPWKDLQMHARYTNNWLYVAPLKGSRAQTIKAGEEFGVVYNEDRLKLQMLPQDKWHGPEKYKENPAKHAADGFSHTNAVVEDGAVIEPKRKTTGELLEDENGKLIPDMGSGGNEPNYVLTLPEGHNAQFLKIDDLKFNYYGNIHLVDWDTKVKEGESEARVFYATEGQDAFDQVMNAENIQYNAVRPDDISTHPIKDNKKENVIRDRILYMGMGAERTIEAYLTPSSANVRNIVWTSKNPDLLTVNGGAEARTDDNQVQLNVTDKAKAGNTIKVEAKLPDWADKPYDESVAERDRPGQAYFTIEIVDLHGSGTEDDPYTIENEDELKKFRDLVNGDENHAASDFDGDWILLKNDVDLKDQEWTPIGKDKNHPFQGTFIGESDDAGRRIIKGLKTKKDEDYQGLFGYVGDKGHIQSIAVIDGTINGNENVGGIAGYSAGIIEDSRSNVDVNGNKNVGGVVGYNYNGTITGVTYGKKIVEEKGDENTEDNKDTEKYGKVTGELESVGGIVGKNDGQNASIEGATVNAYVEIPDALKTATDLLDKRNDDAEERYHGTNQGRPYIGAIAGEAFLVSDDSSHLKEEFKNCYYQQNSEKNVNLHGIGNVCPEPSSIIFNGPTESIFDKGAGTASNPYVIKDLKDFKALRDLVNSGDDCSGCYYSLDTDLDLSEEDNWEPIGDYATSNRLDFAGNFDGAGHKITGLKINAKDKDYQGLFGYNKGTIQNLTVYGEVNAHDYVGGITGRNDGKIMNCHSYVTVTGNEKVGGIAGSNQTSRSEIKDSENRGDVTGNKNTGGITGTNSGNINNSQNIPDEDGKGGSVTGNGNNTGGIAGTNEAGGKIDKGTNEGDITGKGDNTGGIAGKNDGDITDSENKGTVNGKKDGAGKGGNNTGGIAGDNNGTIGNGNNSGTVKGEGNNTGGIAGTNEKNGSIDKGNNTGDVTGEKYTGGIAGKNDGTITGSKNGTEGGNDGNVTGNKDTGGIAGENNGTIEKNNINNGGVKGTENTGGIAGDNHGDIDDAHNKGDVEGDKNTGGIAGDNDGNITNSDNEGKVNGNKDNTGGIAGNNKGTIDTVENKGTVTGNGGDNTGGIAGNNESEGTIKKGDNKGDVTSNGGDNTGGIAGNNDGTIEDSTNSGKVTGNKDENGEGGNNTGGIAGNNNGDINKGHNKGDVEGDGDNTGGIAGNNNGNIKDSDNEGKVTGGGDNTGGIAGTNDKDGTIDKSTNKGDVKGEGDNTGGIAGDNKGTIKDSTNDGDVEGKGDNTGGIAGKNDGDIDNSTNNGNVKGDGNNTGGIAGNNGTDGNIKDSTNNGDVEGKGENTGGIAGKNDGNIDNGTNNGNVTGDKNVGGLVGSNGPNGTATGNNNGNVTGNTNVGGLVGSNDNPKEDAIQGNFLQDATHNNGLHGIGAGTGSGPNNIYITVNQPWVPGQGDPAPGTPTPPVGTGSPAPGTPTPTPTVTPSSDPLASPDASPSASPDVSPSASPLLAKNAKFTAGNFQYQVTTAAKRDAAGKVTKGKVKIIKLSAAGKKKASLSVAKEVKKDATYTITALGKDAFKSAKKNATISLSKNTSIKKLPAGIFKGSKAKKITLNTKTAYTLPASAFANCKNLTTVTINDKIKKIPASAFANCSKLKTVTLGKKITAIPKSAFTKCTKLNKLTLKAKLKKVTKNAFKGCKKKISIKGSTSKNRKANVNLLKKKSGYKKFKKS